MGSIAVADLNAMLNAFCRQTAYTGHAAVWCKMHTGDPGSAGANNAAGNTSRVQSTFGSAAASGIIANTAACVWSNVSTTETYTYVSLWTASTGGTYIGSDILASSVSVTAGDGFYIPVGSITVSFLTGVGILATATREAFLNSYARGTSYGGNNGLWLKLHLGAPGTAGTSNPANNATRQQGVFATNASGGAIANTSAISWTLIGTAETYTHVSFWTASTGGTFLGSDDLSSPASVAFLDTFQIVVGGMTLTLS